MLYVKGKEISKLKVNFVKKEVEKVNEERGMKL